MACERLAQCERALTMILVISYYVFKKFVSAYIQTLAYRAYLLIELMSFSFGYSILYAKYIHGKTYMHNLGYSIIYYYETNLYA